MKTFAATAMAILLACAPALAQTPETGAMIGTWGFDPAGRDMTVRPGDDFFRHANGGWLDTVGMVDPSGSVTAFSQVRALSDRRVAEMLAGLSEASQDPETIRLRAFHASFMDEARIEALGARPLAPLLEAIKGATTHAALAALAGECAGEFGDGLFLLAVSADPRDGRRNALHVRPARGSLPNGYLTDGARAGVKAAYRAYVRSSLESLDWPEARRRADQIVTFETQLARIAERSRSAPARAEDARSVEALRRRAPDFDWTGYLGGAGFAGTDEVFAADEEALAQQAELFAATPVAVLQAWQAFRVLDEAAPYLSSSYAERRWDFRVRTMTGQDRRRTREQQAGAMLETYMGDALGRFYVERWFPPEHRARVEEIAETLKAAAERRIRATDRLSPEGRAAALEKLAALEIEIGYPRRWRDYSSLEMREDDLIGNVRRAARRNWTDRIAALNEAPGDEPWSLSVQAPNAYYNGQANRIVVTAALLQPPFFDPAADSAVNYGAIAAIIGHHLANAVDDQGSRRDASGRERAWWTPADRAAFNREAERLAAQYASLEPAPGVRLNPAQTRSADMADLVGVTLGLDAWRASTGDAAPPVLDGTTGEQRFFYGWAQTWRARQGPDRLRNQIAGDPHSPPEVRAVAPLRNIDSWYAAFGVGPDQAQYLPPEDRVRVW